MVLSVFSIHKWSTLEHSSFIQLCSYCDLFFLLLFIQKKMQSNPSFIYSFIRPFILMNLFAPSGVLSSPCAIQCGRGVLPRPDARGGGARGGPHLRERPQRHPPPPQHPGQVREAAAILCPPLASHLRGQLWLWLVPYWSCIIDYILAFVFCHVLVSTANRYNVPFMDCLDSLVHYSGSVSKIFWYDICPTIVSRRRLR